MNQIEKKAIAIVGPTASGKTGLAVKLALHFNGEVVSADSRQVYKYMDVGSGKDLQDYLVKIPNSKFPHLAKATRDRQIPNKFQFPIIKIQNRKFYAVPYHCIDLVHPNTKFDLVRWRRKAEKSVLDILGRDRLPIIAGGTGLYAQALIEGYNLTEIGPDSDLRSELESLNIKQLLARLKKIDIKKFQGLNNSEKNNKRHLIRYIEIASCNKPKLKKPLILRNAVSAGRQEAHEGSRVSSIHSRDSLPQALPSVALRSAPLRMTSEDINYLVIGIKYPIDVLRERIYMRLVDRLENEDMVGEVEKLHSEYKVSWSRLSSFGLEYKFITMYLRNQIGYNEMVEKLNIAIGQFAKRQLSWYRRWERQGREIVWVSGVTEAKRLIKGFLR